MNENKLVMLTEHEAKVISKVARRFSVSLAEKAGDVVMITDAELNEILSKAMNSHLHLQVAAAHFVNVSPVAADIAKAVNSTPDTILEWAKLPEWKKAVSWWGWTGDPQPQKSRQLERIPVPLQEAFLLKNVFQKDSDVRFITDAGSIDARVEEVARFDIRLADGRSLRKINVILAFPKDSMPYVRDGIKRRESVKAQDLTYIQRGRNRPKIDVVARIGDLVECVTRNGLIIHGENIWVSKYNIVLRVGGQKGRGGKVVLVYRHALLQFRVLKQKPKRHREYHDGWDDEGEKQKALPLSPKSKRIHTSYRDEKVEILRELSRDSEEE